MEIIVEYIDKLEVDKLDIADEFLEVGIKCFFNQEYASAIHLAGAAQELYGKWIRVEGGKNISLQAIDIFEKLSKEQEVCFDRKETQKIERWAKNTLKHMDSENDRFIQIDLESEATKSLFEAMVDRGTIGKKGTESIEKFQKYIRKNLINTFKNIFYKKSNT